MITIREAAETVHMITSENLDVRTITMGISLLDCVDTDLSLLNEKIWNKITRLAKDLVRTGEEISGEYAGETRNSANVQNKRNCRISTEWLVRQSFLCAWEQVGIH